MTFSLGVQGHWGRGRAERTPNNKYPGLSSYKDTSSIKLGPTLITPFNLNYLLMGPNTATLGLGLQNKTFTETQSVKRVFYSQFVHIKGY